MWLIMIGNYMVRLNTQRHKLPSTFEHCEIKKNILNILRINFL